MKYTGVTGKTVTVIQQGKSFRSVTYYPAKGRSPAETVTKNHKTWQSVERIITTSIS